MLICTCTLFHYKTILFQRQKRRKRKPILSQERGSPKIRVSIIINWIKCANDYRGYIDCSLKKLVFSHVVVK